ncbi:rho GTPase-activating protein 3-like isoform X2 [Neltuma alba]|uniref:rho GTPase-activating protein 3-like isoform X2 n=1 Tax=Neltuma alba TaxID=207710 RepID=UPI0010A4A39F|nr:rho GTPase-activating protein 3-like isoform X2 [Prosopis alba]
MTRLFRSKSWEFVRRTEFSPSPLSPSLCNFKKQEEAEDELVGDDDSRKSISKVGVADNNQSHFAMLDTVVEALKKSLVTCSVEKEDDSSMDISWPTEVRHVSHVTFDRLHGFLDLPSELEPEVPRSASAKVFGVSAESMECSYDDRGNCVPKILLSMQKQLYSEGGLKVEGIFRINAESSQEESVRDQLNKGAVPYGTDVHCLSGLIKIMDPLTALTHAVQVVKFLKTLILKVLRERDKSNAEARRLSPCSDSPYLETDPLPSNFNSEEACEKNEDSCTKKPSLKDNFLRTSTLGRIEWRIKEKLWISEESECVIHDSTPSRREIRTSEYRYRRYDGDRWLRLRKRLHKLWRHPVFLWNKASKPAT